ncbi:hypothetical protein PINS_up003633 [Pythium insidiosum]|nr:hypothetical protein PINS_up003633 [Pythium insidiosum]
MGMFGEKGAYLMDPWNGLDFAVVFVGLLATIPGIPNVSVLRTFRALRPLRSLNAVAGMKKLINALLKSIPELLTVVAFLSFLFFLYGVIGVQLWSGVLHSRCRLTPYPVRLDSNITLESLATYQDLVVRNFSQYRCSFKNGDPIPAIGSWTHDTSPWRHPRQCFWPIADESPAQTCSLDGVSNRLCPAGQTCGSDYDAFGNFRFRHPREEMDHYLLRAATHNPDLSWGLVNFDNIAAAALAIFQCITREGWTDIMYSLQDAGFNIIAVGYFVSFIIFGSYFMLNLTLAVIWENFSESSFQEAEERKRQRKLHQQNGPKRERHVSDGLATSTIRRFVYRVITHKLFEWLRTTLILLNTVILSLDQYPSDEKVEHAVEVISFCLTIAFAVECLLKITALGWRKWGRDGYNLFDALVVLLGIVELLLSPPDFFPGEQQDSKGTASLSGLRSFRLFALFRLARSWPSLQQLLATMLSTLREVGNFSVLFLLFMYIYALIGMQTFANQFQFDVHGNRASRPENIYYIPRSNFDTLLWSLVTVFQILTGENWNTVMLDGWRSSGWSAVLYFVSLVVLGNFIVLNLFLAILLGNFDETSEQEKEDERERDLLRKKSRVAPSSRRSVASVRERATATSTGSSRERTGRRNGDASARSYREPMSSNHSKMFNDSHVPKHYGHKLEDAYKTTKGRSLMIFSPTNRLRKAAIKTIHHPRFDHASLLLIALSTLALAMDNPLNPPDSPLVIALSWVDSVLTVLFIAEVVTKVVALGLIADTHAYLRNGWNVMDFVITTLATFSLYDGSARFKFVKTLRTFRALRPLRMINRNPGLRLVVSSLIASIPQLINVIMVCLLVFFVFSILAVNNLKGKLYSCQGDAFDALSTAQQHLITYPRLWADLAPDEKTWFNTSVAAAYSSILAQTDVTSRVLCGFFGASWGKTIPQSFDNVLYGCQTFFELTTTEGWVTIMLAGVDATKIDMQPIPNYREEWAFFFITFILVGTFFVMQLFVGVVIDNFNRMKEKLEGTHLLSVTQREWLLINEAMLNLRPMRKLKIPQERFRRMMFSLARNSTFELVIVGCIVLNTTIMALHYFGEDDLYGKAIEFTNYFFALVFALEAAIKVYGLGHYYWKDRWNIFDFVLVLGSFLGMLYQWVGGSSVGTVATSIRSFRVGRLFRLVQSAPSLRQLFNTLLITLPSLVNIGGLLFLVFFIYAAMGVQLFAKVKFGELITRTANFQSITRAMVTLVRCATGERWNDMMYELATQSDCTPDPDYDPHMCGFNNTLGCVDLNGCGSPVAFIYMYSFTLIVSFILLNIFIAVILEGFSNEKDRTEGILLPQHYENFVTTWSMFDPEATGFIDWHVLPRFLEALEPPLGFHPSCKPSRKQIEYFAQGLDLPIFRGTKVFFNDVGRRMGKVIIDETSDEPLRALPAIMNMEQRWRKYLASRNVKKQDITMFRVNQFHAGVILHTAVKSLIFQSDLKEKVRKFTQRMTATQHFPQQSVPTPKVQEVDEVDDLMRLIEAENEGLDA